MLGQRSEWCVIMSYDETDPTNPSKMTFSRENIPLNNNKGMPGRPPKVSPYHCEVNSLKCDVSVNAQAVAAAASMMSRSRFPFRQSSSDSIW